MSDPSTIPQGRTETPRREFRWSFFGLLVLSVMLVIVFATVLKMRLNSGEIYPHYSSLRSDPLGTRALYETLQRLPGIAVERNLRPLRTIQGVEENCTVLLLGVPRGDLVWLDVDEKSSLLRAVQRGARLVVTVNPGLVPRSGADAEAEWWKRHQRIRKAEEESGRRGRELSAEERREIIERLQQEKRDGVDNDDSELFPNLVSNLGARVVVPDDFDRPDKGWSLIGSERLPAGLPRWFSHCRLDKLSDDWQVIATTSREAQAVIAERRYGKGSVVLISDSHFASNEALWKGAESEFLLWMAGDKERIIFDESIHGARSSSNLAQWIVRHRLHGVVFGLLVVAALFAWRSGSSLIPKRDDRNASGFTGTAVLGEAVDSGLPKLLRRAVKPSGLVQRCVELWRESAERSGAGRKTVSAKRKEIEAAAAADSDPVASFRRIAEIVRKSRL